ncbi:MAG: DUF4199 domain-containing protein [Bacteroidales bacterium]|jgi:hypothetical protein|nr:DUF4199 domain-containing protein [Bacteroidales bacterium]MDY0016103.1 DUF4199 domain-containing protein [Bacteroidales bacterium]
MNKNLASVSLRWGSLIAAVQILSHLLLIYVFVNTQLTIKQAVEIATLLITLFLIYLAIHDYKQRCQEDKTFTLLQAFVAALFACLVFALLFTIYFFILIQCIDPDFLHNKIIAAQKIQNNAPAITPISYLTNYINSYLIFQLTAALFMAAVMQRKIKIKDPNDKAEK